MKILLTGARGFTGRHLADLAQREGHEVVLLKSDLCRPQDLEDEIRALNFTHVVHLAGISFVGNEDDRAFYDVNLFGSLNLLKALSGLDRKPQKIILASSANVYGNARVSPITEDQPPQPTNHYALSKLAMEHMARTFEPDLPILLARIFNSTGPGQSRSFLIPKLIQHYQERAPTIELGNLAIEREFNDIRMVARAYLGLLEKGLSGETYNVCSGIPYRLEFVIETLNRMTGHQPMIRVNPAFVRANEVLSLCGNPSKMERDLGPSEGYTLEETLGWMLNP